MAHDKKVLNGQLRLVLMQAVGQAIITKTFDVELMKQAIFSQPRAGITLLWQQPFEPSGRQKAKLYLACIRRGMLVWRLKSFGPLRIKRLWLKLKKS